MQNKEKERLEKEAQEKTEKQEAEKRRLEEKILSSATEEYKKKKKPADLMIVIGLSICIFYVVSHCGLAPLLNDSFTHILGLGFLGGLILFFVGVASHPKNPSPTKVSTQKTTRISGLSCPSCRSNNTYMSSDIGCLVCLGCLFFPLSLLILPFVKKEYTCRACGYKWKA